MSKKANPTTVGVFVIGAVFLAIAGILTFSKSTFFRTQQTFVAYFDSSVTGLDVGAPVQILGVQVGTVSGIKGVVDPGTLEIKVPVYLKLDRESLGTTRALTEEEQRVPLERTMEVLVQRGLRAELKQQSLVTGKLFVALVFDPASRERYQGDGQLFEIPTIEGGLAKLAKNIEEIDFEGLVDSATKAVTAVEELVANPEIAELVHNLNELTKKLDEGAGPLLASAQTLMTDSGGLVAKASTLVEDADREMAELSDGAQGFIGDLGEDREVLVDGLRTVLEQINTIQANYAMVQKTSALIEELTAAARAVRLLADYLERHPEALLKGKN